MKSSLNKMNLKNASLISQLADDKSEHTVYFNQSRKVKKSTLKQHP